MTKISYVQPNGAFVSIDVPQGWSAMEGAFKHSVEGIVAECGGACACATCHVYVEEDWLAKLSPPSELERDMLECTAEPAKTNSRLSCQIRITEDMEGMVLHIAGSQL